MNLQIEHRSGKSNVNADVLSRPIDPEYPLVPTDTESQAGTQGGMAEK